MVGVPSTATIACLEWFQLEVRPRQDREPLIARCVENGQEGLEDDDDDDDDGADVKAIQHKLTAGKKTKAKKNKEKKVIAAAHKVHKGPFKYPLHVTIRFPGATCTVLPRELCHSPLGSPKKSDTRICI